MEKEPVWEPIPGWLSEDGIMTVEEFNNAVECDVFIDYDGYGYWSDGKKQMVNGIIIPSKFNLENVPAGVTHVAWYNR